MPTEPDATDPPTNGAPDPRTPPAAPAEPPAPPAAPEPPGEAREEAAGDQPAEVTATGIGAGAGTAAVEPPSPRAPLGPPWPTASSDVAWWRSDTAEPRTAPPRARTRSGENAPTPAAPSTAASSGAASSGAPLSGGPAASARPASEAPARPAATGPDPSPGAVVPRPAGPGRTEPTGPEPSARRTEPTELEPPRLARPFVTAPRVPARIEPPRRPEDRPSPVIPPMRPLPPPASAHPDPVPAPGPAPKVAPATAPPPAVPAAPVRPAVPPPARRSAYGRRLPRRPWVAVPLLVLLALATTFFAWVSVEPFWLAMGHGNTGTATVITETGPGGTCRAAFMAAGQPLSIVDVAGLTSDACTAGTTVSARMLPGGERAYATDDAGLFLRWGSGFGLVLVCALLIVWVTGAARFTGWRRVTSIVVSLAAPVATLIALLTATA